MPVPIPARRAILSSVPAWVAALGYPTAAVDFANGRAWVGGVQYVGDATIRALFTWSTPAHYVVGADDVLYFVPANRMDCSVVPSGLCLGQEFEEARTNKNTNYNANPPALVAMGTAAAFNLAVTNMTASGDAAATFGVVDDSAAMSSGILSALYASGVINGRVYKIDNTAGSTTATITLGGVSGDAGTQAYSVIGRFTGAAGANRLTMLGIDAVNFPAGAYSRVSKASGAGSSSQQIAVQAIAGAVVYFLFNQFEGGSFATSPIAIAGTAVTRAATSISAANGTLLATAASASKAAFFKTASANNAVSVRLAAFAGGAYLILQSTAAQPISSTGSGPVATIGSGGTWAGSVRAAFGYDSAGMAVIANGGAKATNVFAWTGATGTVVFGDNGSGVREVNGPMALFAFGSNSKLKFDGLAA